MGLTSGFESTLDPWSELFGGTSNTVALSSDFAHSGSQSAKLVALSGATGVDIATPGTVPFVGASPGAFTLSAWCYTEDASFATYSLIAAFATAGGASSTGTFFSDPVPVVLGEWVEVPLSGTADAGTEVCQLVVQATGTGTLSGGETAYVDDVAFAQGVSGWIVGRITFGGVTVAVCTTDDFGRADTDSTAGLGTTSSGRPYSGLLNGPVFYVSSDAAAVDTSGLSGGLFFGSLLDLGAPARSWTVSVTPSVDSAGVGLVLAYADDDNFLAVVADGFRYTLYTVIGGSYAAVLFGFFDAGSTYTLRVERWGTQYVLGVDEDEFSGTDYDLSTSDGAFLAGSSNVGGVVASGDEDGASLLDDLSICPGITPVVGTWGFEDDAGPWGAKNNCTADVSGSEANSGAQSLAVVSGSDTSTGPTFGTTTRVDARSGPMTLTAWVLAPSDVDGVFCSLACYGGSGSLVHSFGLGTVAVTPGTWTEVTFGPVVAPAGTVTVDVTLAESSPGTIAVGEALYVDDITLSCG